MTVDFGEDREEPLILHCFADYGVESEALRCYGNVVRVGISARDTNESMAIKGDAYNVPISDDVGVVDADPGGCRDRGHR